MKKIFIFVMLVLETNITLSQDCDSIINEGYGPALAYGNDTLPFRKQTLYIILHTMEGLLPGGLENLKQNELCNFVVDQYGRIKPIVDEDRISNHAGHSRWNGLDSISNVSVGIEFAGYSRKYPYKKQLDDPVDSLIARIQRKYGIPDSNVLIHSMVACYYPWDPYNPHPGFYYRGRKHDAYYFATLSVRAQLGLTEMVTRDPDVYMGMMLQNISQAKRFYNHVVSEEEIFAYRESIREKRMCDTTLCPITPIMATYISFVINEPEYIVVPDIYNYVPEIDRRKKKKIKADD